jgi:hypothetical protein
MKCVTTISLTRLEEIRSQFKEAPVASWLTVEGRALIFEYYTFETREWKSKFFSRVVVDKDRGVISTHTCGKWEPFLDSSTGVIELVTLDIPPVTLYSSVNIWESFAQYHHIRHSVFRLSSKGLDGISPSYTQTPILAWNTGCSEHEILEITSIKDHDFCIYVARQCKPDYSGGYCDATVQASGQWELLNDTTRDVRILPQASPRFCEEVRKHLLESPTPSLLQTLAPLVFHVSHNHAAIITGECHQRWFSKYSDTNNQNFVMEKLEKHGGAFFKNFSPSELASAMIGAWLKSTPQGDRGYTCKVKLSRSWEALIAQPAYRCAVTSSPEFASYFRVHLLQGPNYQRDLQTLIIKNLTLTELFRASDTLSISPEFSCIRGTEKYAIKRVQILGPEDVLLNTFFTRTNGRQNKLESLSRSWESLIEPGFEVEVLPGVNEELFLNLRKSILDRFALFPHLDTTVFRILGKRLLSDAMDSQRIACSKWYEGRNGFMHEFVVIGFGSSGSEAEQPCTFYVRMERDKYRWVSVGRTDLTEEYVRLCPTEQPLLEPSARLKLSLRVNSDTPNSNRPSFRGLVAITDNLRERGPTYNLFGQNCWWYASWLAVELKQRIGSANCQILTYQ